MGHGSRLLRSNDTGSRATRFRGGLKPLLPFLSAFALYAIIVNTAKAGVGASDIPAPFDIAGTISSISVMGLVVWLLLRYDGVQHREIGFTPKPALMGVVAVGGFWLGLNAIGAGLNTVTEARASIGYRSEASLLLVAGFVIEQYLFVGLLEELAFRGYLQGKLIALLGGRDSRAGVVLGIGTTSVVFAAMHLPNRLFVKSLAVSELTVNLAFLAVAGVVLGLLYELTRNVVFIGLLHGTGNLWPLFVDPWTWPTTVLLIWIAGGGVLLGATVWSYRRWVGGPRPPILGRPVAFHR